jgi:hypothetical protein
MNMKFPSSALDLDRIRKEYHEAKQQGSNR